MHPKVFISHASEDKARFVMGFAERLRAIGVDAWLDRWEMLPGDSLVDKIFEEGLRQATAVIVVLSNNSVDKPWVREELNAAFVKRVNSGSKLIPVVLEDCKIPEALASTLWEHIKTLDSYDDSFDRIVAAITGAKDKPPLGSLPGYVTSPIREIAGLARLDNIVLKASCELALNGGHDLIDGPELVASEAMKDVPEQEIDESLEILERANLIDVSRHIGPGLPHFRITTYGFQQYAQTYIDGYERKINEVALAIVNLKISDNESLSTTLKFEKFFVDHALDILETQGYIRLAKSIGGLRHIYEVSATLRRALA